MRIIDYTIVQSVDGMDRLIRYVQTRIGEGWQPLGSAIKSKDDYSNHIWVQTMVKYEELEC